MNVKAGGEPTCPAAARRWAMRVKDKIALVTGGARGMGASHARLLAEHGAAVVVGDVLDEEGQATVRRLADDGHDARYVSLDVTSEESWGRAVADVASSLGQIDILVNNAGVGSVAGGVEVEGPAGWAQTVAVNQTGTYLGMRATVPGMKRAGGG